MSRSDGRAADEPFSWTAAGSRPKDKKHQVHKEPVHRLQKFTRSQTIDKPTAPSLITKDGKAVVRSTDHRSHHQWIKPRLSEKRQYST